MRNQEREIKETHVAVQDKDTNLKWNQKYKVIIHLTKLLFYIELLFKNNN